MQNIALFLSYKTQAARTMISSARARPQKDGVLWTEPTFSAFRPQKGSVLWTDRLFLSARSPGKAALRGRIPALSLYLPEIANRSAELAILAGDKLLPTAAR
jgi:hypothetical protein